MKTAFKLFLTLFCLSLSLLAVQSAQALRIANSSRFDMKVTLKVGDGRDPVTVLPETLLPADPYGNSTTVTLSNSQASKLRYPWYLTIKIGSDTYNLFIAERNIERLKDFVDDTGTELDIIDQGQHKQPRFTLSLWKRGYKGCTVGYNQYE